MNKLIRNTLVFAVLMTSFTLAYAEETLDLSDFDDAQDGRDGTRSGSVDVSDSV